MSNSFRPHGLPGSSLHGIFQARILEWVAISFSRVSSQPRDSTRIYPHCRQTVYHLSQSRQSCPTLCDAIDGSPPGSPVPGILQARTLEWVAISFSNAEKVKSESEVAQSCPTLCDAIDGSPPGSPVPGILQARTLEWAAISFSNA